ncbi:MAG: glycosyltransferase [Candidatus Cryptobacteroides sp.]|nr:glycosyltransferase [Candidatus Cryptobacteroides sp.]
MAQVSVVIVCMGNPAVHLYACLDSLFAQNRTPLDVWVVAYLMQAEHREALAARYPAIHIIESREVRGFAENNNLALRQIDSEYCFVVNDDTLQSMPVVDRLLEDFAKLPENAAVVQPKIVFGDGRVQTCGRTPWTAWRYAKHYLHLVKEGETEGGIGSRISGHPRPDKREGPTAVPIGTLRDGRGRSEAEAIRESMPPSVVRTYTLNGACFLIKTAVFRKMGWFDERYFFTPEDIALGHALNNAGYSVWVHPEVCITHLAGGSVSAMEQAIKPARVRGSLIFYGEPLWLKCFIWSVELARYVKNSLLCREQNRKTARNVMKTVFSKQTPKEIFIRFKP